MALNALRKMLDEHGVSQTELAHASNVSVGTVNKVCQQKLTPAPKTKGKLLKALNEITGTEYEHDHIFTQTLEKKDD